MRLLQTWTPPRLGNDSHKKAQNSQNRFVNFVPFRGNYITRSCPHVHLALISNSLMPLGVAFGLCRVCLLKTIPNSRSSSSRLEHPYVRPWNSIPSLFTSHTIVFSLFTTSFRRAFRFPTSRRKN